jgi:hypothetical protein
VKTRDLVRRCLKTRIVSWLTETPQAVMLPGGYVFAVYYNGRRVEPEKIVIPNMVPPEWLGPDGPLRQPPGDDKPEGDGDGKPEE